MSNITQIFNLQINTWHLHSCLIMNTSIIILCHAQIWRLTLDCACISLIMWMWGVAEQRSGLRRRLRLETQALLITAQNNTEDTNLRFCGQLYHRLPEIQLRVRVSHFPWYDRLLMRLCSNPCHLLLCVCHLRRRRSCAKHTNFRDEALTVLLWSGQPHEY